MPDFWLERWQNYFSIPSKSILNAILQHASGASNKSAFKAAFK